MTNLCLAVAIQVVRVHVPLTRRALRTAGKNVLATVITTNGHWKNCDWTLVYWAWWEMSWNKTPARVDRVKETSSRLNWSLVLAVFDQQFPCKLLRRKPPTLWLHGKPILSLGPAAEEVSFSKQVVPGQNVPLALFAQSIFNLTAFPIYPSISRALSDG